MSFLTKRGSAAGFIPSNRAEPRSICLAKNLFVLSVRLAPYLGVGDANEFARLILYCRRGVKARAK